MKSAEQEAIDAIQHLFDSIDIEEMMYRHYVFDKARRGQRDANNNYTQSIEELLTEIKAR